MWKFFLFSVFYFISCLVWAQSTVDDENHTLRLKELNERYLDFFTRLREQELWNTELERSGRTLRTERTQALKDMELQRQQFVRERKAKPDDTVLQRQWEAEERQWYRENDGARREFVRRRDRERALVQGARKIPENKEYNLDE